MSANRTEIQALESVKKSVLEHDYFKRAEGITQIIPKKISSIEIGQVVSPIKRPLQSRIENLYSDIKVQPKILRDSGDSRKSFLSRHLESRKSNDVSSIGESVRAIKGMMEVGQNTLNNRKKHSKEVAQISRKLGEELNLSEKNIVVAEILLCAMTLGMRLLDIPGKGLWRAN